MADTNYIKTIVRNFMHRETSQETQQKFRQWIIDPDERKTKDEALEEAWHNTEAVYSLADKKGWTRLSETICAQTQRTRTRQWQRLAIGIAAGIALGLFGLQHLMLTNRIEQAIQEATLCYVTAHNSKGLFTLPDGTTVWLNGNSKLTLPSTFDDHQRYVQLEGEAFFDVKKNPKQPFIVDLGTRQIEVLGTAFDVKNYADLDYQEIVLVRGSIHIHSKGCPSVQLCPNERYVAQTQGTKTSIETVDAIDYSQWMERMLIFDNKPLKTILVSLARWYNMEFDVANNIDLNVCMSFNVKYESVDEILRALSRITPVGYQIDYVNRRVYISPR